MTTTAATTAYINHCGREGLAAAGAELGGAAAALLDAAAAMALPGPATGTEPLLMAGGAPDPLGGATGAGSPTSRGVLRPDSSSRCTRFKSARMSAAFW